MNTYRMEYERQHKKAEPPIIAYVVIGITTFMVMMAITAAVAYADVAPRVIYQDVGNPTGKTAEVGIAPGVNIYVPDCDEPPISDESSTQFTTANGENGIKNAKSDIHLHEYSNISISDSEMEELKRIVAAEAQNQSMEGREAVVEVIFNRVLSDEWPDTVHGVLSQKGQFATWRMQYQSWVVPDAAVAAIEYVLENGRTVLPDTSYVYFDTKGRNGKGHLRIGAHYFGK